MYGDSLRHPAQHTHVEATACSNDVCVMQKEIFGPVFPLVAAESLDATIAYVNDRPHPLAPYLCSDSGAQQQHVLQFTLAGGVSANETLMHIAQEGLPNGCADTLNIRV